MYILNSVESKFIHITALPGMKLDLWQWKDSSEWNMTTFEDWQDMVSLLQGASFGVWDNTWHILDASHILLLDRPHIGHGFWVDKRYSHGVSEAAHLFNKFGDQLPGSPARRVAFWRLASSAALRQEDACCWVGSWLTTVGCPGALIFWHPSALKCCLCFTQIYRNRITGTWFCIMGGVSL